MRTRLFVTCTIFVLSIGCSSPAPTAPAGAGGATIGAHGTALSTPLPADNPASHCEVFGGTQYRGVCQAGAALQCSLPESPNAERCDRLRVYVSRDPVACSAILWLCPEGFEVFSDESGCGCKVYTP